MKTWRLKFSRLALTGMACCFLANCAFSQWTEYYFFGDGGKRPVYEHRVATGLAVLPFALITDLATFPIQGVLLVIKGDDFLYKTSPYVTGGYSSQARAQRSSAVAQLTPAQRERLQLEASERIEALESAGVAGSVAFGIRNDGSLADLRLSSEALDQLRARVRAEHIYQGSSLTSECNDPAQ